MHIYIEKLLNSTECSYNSYFYE